MKSIVLCLMLVASLTVCSVAECRVGGGRSFGNRGSRGLMAPRRSNTSSFGSPYRSAQPAQPAQPMNPNYGWNQPRPQGPSLWKTFGAGLAGGVLGNMLFRSFGGGNAMGGYSGGGSGIGLFEILILGGLLFMLFRLFVSRRASQSQSNFGRSDEAADLMKRARPGGWDGLRDVSQDSYETEYSGDPIEKDTAMDLFFRVQGAWGNRELTGVQDILDNDVKSYLNQEISRLKSAHEINRLENIAVRDVEVIESWAEGNREYSTVKFSANLLDYTINEDTQQVVQGNKLTPVKFEEYWTFLREDGRSDWKLSAIQQS